ncbi:MAG: hypothetical protein R2772_03800 [Chitinophagales bacterium]
MNHLEFINQIKDFPDYSKLWLYQANRLLTGTEQELVALKLDQFTQNWAAHGKALNAKSAILFNSLLVFAVDGSSENASGCSIDSSVRFVKGVGEDLAIDFMDRTIVLAVDKDKWEIKKIKDIKAGEIIADYSISTLREFKTNLLQEFSSSAYANLVASTSFSLKL